MSYREPTISELFATYLAQLETSLGQDAPVNDKAFLRILAIIMAGMSKGNYKLGSDAATQNLALTATGEGLDRIGNDNNTPRKLAEYAIMTATLPATTGTLIPATTDFYADATGLRYRPTEDVTAVAGVATLSLRCTESGTSGNLENGDTLSIGSQIAGATTVATVTATDTLGVDEETDADYRPRVLFAQRAITGGGNPSDHKIWAEAVTGVKTCYPYTGRPAGVGTSYPGDRTLYIECTTDVEPDGIAPAGLLDDVRDAINTDPDTGVARPCLGLTDDTLFIYAIERNEIYVTLHGLTVDAGNEIACKAAIVAALTTYFLSCEPFTVGTGLSEYKNNIITATSISQVLQDVLTSYEATCNSVTFNAGGSEIPSYTLANGEKVKYGGITYSV